MESLGQFIRKERIKKGLLLRHLSALVDIDPAILSKIERGERKPSKENVIKIAEILKIKKDNLLVQYYGEKIAEEIAYEPIANEVLKVAEAKIKYLNKNKIFKNGTHN